MSDQKEFFYQTIQFAVDKEDELYKRLKAQAERYGMTVEQLVTATGAMGLYHYISRNLTVFENGKPQNEAGPDTEGKA